MSQQSRNGHSRSLAILFVLFIASLALSACSTTHDWKEYEDYNQANISVDLPGTNLIRTAAQIKRFHSGWVESGDWQDHESDPKIHVYAMVLSTSDSVFTDSHIDPLSESIRALSGDGYVVLGDEGQFKTRTGDVRYQFYELSGLTCVLIENFWADPTIAKYDGVAGDVAARIIGNALLRTYYCNEDFETMTLADVDWFLGSLKVRDVYWPEKRFERY